MLRTRDYCRRPFTREERSRIAMAMSAAEWAWKNSGMNDVEIRMYNTRNPNGITVRRSTNQPVIAERFINLGWARRKGYERI
jgi:hypothetical protein